MKKLLALFLLIPVLGFSQTIRTHISEGKFGTIEGDFYKTIEDGDTSYYLGCSFQNAEYEYVTDIASIFITDQLTLDSLISDLQGIIGYVGTKTEISYLRSKYGLVHYDFAVATIYVQDEDGKYTKINKKQAENWLAWLKSIKFPTT
jgi:hypothetical protein